MLAAISPTYYAFLEQGRDVRPSRQVLDALARTLRLTAAERTRLHELVHGDPAPDGADRAELLTDAVSAFVDRLDPCPTYVTGRRFDVLAANRAARTLSTDWTALPVAERNMLWWMFTNPAARTILIDWETEASAQLALRRRRPTSRRPQLPRADRRNTMRGCPVWGARPSDREPICYRRIAFAIF